MSEPYRLFELARDRKHNLIYRQRQPLMDASGSMCGFGEFLEWEIVPCYVKELPSRPVPIMPYSDFTSY